MIEFFLKYVYLPTWLKKILVKIFVPKFLAGVLAILTKKKKILLIKQSYKGETDWRLPGGWLDPRENPIDGVKREIREELGIKLLKPKLINAKFNISLSGIVIVYRQELKSSIKLELSEEIEEVGFFDIKRLPKNLLKSHKNLLIP